MARKRHSAPATGLPVGEGTWVCHAKPATLGRTCGATNVSGATHYQGREVCNTCGCTRTASNHRRDKEETMARRRAERPTVEIPHETLAEITEKWKEEIRKRDSVAHLSPTTTPESEGGETTDE